MYVLHHHSLKKEYMVSPQTSLACILAMETFKDYSVGIFKAHYALNLSLAAFRHRQLRARRALLQFKDVLLRTRRVLLLYKVYDNIALLALN